MGWGTTGTTGVCPCPAGMGWAGMGWTGMGWAGLFERRRWAVPLELCRLVAVGVAALVWGAGQPIVPVLLAVTVVIMCIASAGWVWSRRAALVA